MADLYREEMEYALDYQERHAGNENEFAFALLLVVFIFLIVAAAKQ